MTIPLKNHELVPGVALGKVHYELRPCRKPDGAIAEGLYAAWIVLDNPEQLNSYTTEMVKETIVAFRRASAARDVVAVVFTGAGDRAFCTGGNTKEYAEYYAGRPEEYRQYMRLFNDMVSAILFCDKPVVCRVNGLRIAGGQEIGMAADFSVASDLATFGQAGPKHGSAPDGGATDFLPLFVGIEQAMVSCALCEPWTAYQAHRLGLLTDVVPVLEVGGAVIPNPLVVTDRWCEGGRMVFGEPRTGDALAEGKALRERGRIELAHLDRRVDALVTSILMTMPGCITRTVESVRRHKLEHWDRNKEQSRSWLALNMMGEGLAGFRAFHEGGRGRREVDFVTLRQRIARGDPMDAALIESILPKGQ